MNFIRRRTVASITAALASIVEELKAHAEIKQIEAGHHLGKIEHYQKLVGDAREESEKASATAAKIAALLS